MIKEIYLFTNRNILALDEKGGDMVEIQTAIGWDVKWSEVEKERKCLEKIIEDNPEIYIRSWKDGWKHRINIDEFCSLLGHGWWFWEKYKK